MSKVTIIIPYYNAHAFISETLQSIAMQSHKDLDIVIVNDASTDESVGILKQVIDRTKEKLTIQVIHCEQNMGAANARNMGMKYVTGEYLTFLDADDVLCGAYSLSYRLDFLESHSEFDGVAGYSLRMDGSSRVQFREVPQRAVDEISYISTHPEDVAVRFIEYYLQYRKVLFLIAGGCLFRSSKVNSIPFSQELTKVEDIDWTLQLFEKKISISVQKIPFHIRRLHSNQLHSNTPEELEQAIEAKMRILKSQLTSE